MLVRYWIVVCVVSLLVGGCPSNGSGPAVGDSDTAGDAPAGQGPALQALTPTVGFPGTVVTLTGARFEPASGNLIVLIGTEMSIGDNVTDTSATFAVPEGTEPGDLQISVRTMQGTSNELTFALEYEADRPLIREVDPPMMISRFLTLGLAGDAFCDPACLTIVLGDQQFAPSASTDTLAFLEIPGDFPLGAHRLAVIRNGKLSNYRFITVK